MLETCLQSPDRPPFSSWRKAFLVLLAGTAAAALLAYLAATGGAGSFAFLSAATGWDIAFSILPYSSGDPYWWVFLVGVVNTMVAGTLAIVLATILGFMLGLARLSANRLLADLATLYVNVVRNVPLILQAMFWYAFVLHFPPARSSYRFLDSVFLSNRGLIIPRFSDSLVVLATTVSVIAAIAGALALRRRMRERSQKTNLALVPATWICGIAIAALAALGPRLSSAFAIDWPVLAGLNFRGGFRLSPEFVALVAAITLYRSAFLAEVFRGGFLAVSKGQIDAANSLGLRPWTTLVKIRIPLALVSIMPPLSSEYLIIMKVTSIGIIVGYMDLFAVSSMSSMMTGRAIEVLVAMTAVYLVLNYSIASGMNALNRRFRIKGR